MRPSFKAVLALALASSVLGACSTAHVGGVALSPNPAPPPGYRVVCSSVPPILSFIPTPLDGYHSHCAPVRAPVIERRTVIRAKG